MYNFLVACLTILMVGSTIAVIVFQPLVLVGIVALYGAAYLFAGN